MTLSLGEVDLALLAGARGPAAALAMRWLSRFADSVDAPRLIDISQAHIDGCLYLGQASLDFVERFVKLNGRVAVPTTLNVGSMDLTRPERFRGSDEARGNARRLMEAHLELGCAATFTCAPYQTDYRPRFGANIAWGESNAIVFANSVIGARTERYGDFVDLLCALTGRAPEFGLHVRENRRARFVLEIASVPDDWDDGLVATVVGYVLGRLNHGIAAIVGLPATTNDDDLKALGAAAASSGAVAMFHAVGRTPEAANLADATQGKPVETVVTLDAAALRAAARSLSMLEDGAPLDAISLGTPHFSIAEFAKLGALIEGERARIDVWINTGRATFRALQERGDSEKFERFGVKFVVDSCVYAAPILSPSTKAIMTSSGKCAYYAAANMGVEVAFGSLAECVASARAARVTRL